mgnify:FL=1
MQFTKEEIQKAIENLNNRKRILRMMILEECNATSRETYYTETMKQIEVRIEELEKDLGAL